MSNSEPSKMDLIEDRLDRITNILNIVTETAIKNENNIAALTQKTEEHDRLIDGLIAATTQNTEAIVSLNRGIDGLIATTTKNAEAIASLNNYAQEIFTRFDIMQSEIRGLQTENRRILDRLLGEETDENNN